MKIGFTGTQRGLNSYQLGRLKEVLVQIVSKHPGQHQFHHGDCIGADAQAHEIALEWGYHVHVHPPLDPSKRAFVKGFQVMNEPAPYLVRNKNIVNAVDWMIVGPLTNQQTLRSGTWSTWRFAMAREKIITMLWRFG